MNLPEIIRIKDSLVMVFPVETATGSLEPWYRAVDFFAVFNLAGGGELIQTLVEDQWKILTLDREVLIPNGDMVKEIVVVNDLGLYQLILNSDKNDVKKREDLMSVTDLRRLWIDKLKKELSPSSVSRNDIFKFSKN